MAVENKACSRCNEFKSLSEFYKQGSRYESLCKECKKKARKGIADDFFPVENSKEEISPVSSNKVHTKFEREVEVMPVFDESIFFPEKAFEELGLNHDDIMELAAFVRWHIEQRDKQSKKEEIE